MGLSALLGFGNWDRSSLPRRQSRSVILRRPRSCVEPPTMGAPVRPVSTPVVDRYLMRSHPPCAATDVRTVPVGTVTDAAGNTNTAATSTDNTITYNGP
jgi:hypothetical protein